MRLPYVVSIDFWQYKVEVEGFMYGMTYHDKYSYMPLTRIRFSSQGKSLPVIKQLKQWHFDREQVVSQVCLTFSRFQDEATFDSFPFSARVPMLVSYASHR